MIEIELPPKQTIGWIDTRILTHASSMHSLHTQSLPWGKQPVGILQQNDYFLWKNG